MSYGDGDELTKFELAAEAAGVAWWMMVIPSGVIFFSPNKTSMLGYDDKNFNHYSDFTELVHKEDYGPMMAAMYELLDGKTDTYETTYRIKTKSGKYKRFYDRGRIVAKKNGETTVAGFVFNVSDFEFPTAELDSEE